MSTRALRRLNDADIFDAEVLSDSDDTSDPIDHSRLNSGSGNKFNFLAQPSDESDLDNINSDALSEQDKSPVPAIKAETIKDDAPEPASTVCRSGVAHTKKKKKKKKATASNSNENAHEEANFELDTDETFSNNRVAASLPPRKSILTVESKNLNPENEMERRFGARTTSRRSRSRYSRPNSKLVSQKADWPPCVRTGVSMRRLSQSSSSSGNTNSIHFTFEHSPAYQKIQAEFLTAVESYDPSNLVALLRENPYHTDALIQLSETARLQEDMDTARSLIERALFCFENASHPVFSLTSGSCRLDYRYPENSLCEEDPLAVILCIDFFALKCDHSSQLQWLVDFFDLLEVGKSLSLLPNFAFSVPLALHLLSKQGGDNSDILSKRADSMVQESLLKFPSVLLPLLEKCSVSADDAVANDPLFHSENSESRGLSQLIRLYVNRCFHCWKDPSVIQWLESQVHALQSGLQANNERLNAQFNEFKKIRQENYRGTPRNIYRHILLSGIEETTVFLPQDLTSSPLYAYDPFPPLDSFTTYTIPQQRRRFPSEYNSWSMFAHSLLPNFDLNEELTSADHERRRRRFGERVAESDGTPTAGNVQLLHNIMESIGNLLNNIEFTPPPVENTDNLGPNDEDNDFDGH